MNWSRDLATWSLSHLSRRITVGAQTWHVQETGDGPLVLLLHGAGASVHTWRGIIPALAESARAVAIDLPGHGFSGRAAPGRAGLDAMTLALTRLLEDRGWRPEAILAHSAGAALGLRLAARLGVPRLVGVNPALAPFGGVAGWLFPALARLLVLNPLTVPLFTMGTSPARTRRLIEGTGSRLDDDGLAFYTRLMADRDHVAGTLAMMADWRLDPLIAEMPRLDTRALFLSGARDRAVPPVTARDAAAAMPRARVESLAGLGHLAHEEDPDAVLRRALDHLLGRAETLDRSAPSGG